MKRARFEKLDSYADRVRRSSREIMIASALTLAAIAFLVAALMGGAVKGEKDMGHNDVGHNDMGHVAADEMVIK